MNARSQNQPEYEWRLRAEHAPAHIHVFPTKSDETATPKSKNNALFAVKSLKLSRTEIWMLGFGILILIAASGYASTQSRAMQASLTAPAVASPAPRNGYAVADLDLALETSHVALRGYLLTGQDGFRQEWLRALYGVQSSNAQLETEAKSWINGQKLLQLELVQKSIKNLIEQQRLVAGLVGTPNRYPGRRYYDESIVPKITQAEALSDTALNSIIANPAADREKIIEYLAALRGDIHLVRTTLPHYLETGSPRKIPANLVNHIDKIKTIRSDIANIKYQASPADQITLEKLAALGADISKEIQRTITLRQTQRWDYADYAFRQQIMPAMLATLITLRGWSTAEQRITLRANLVPRA